MASVTLKGPLRTDAMPPRARFILLKLLRIGGHIERLLYWVVGKFVTYFLTYVD